MQTYKIIFIPLSVIVGVALLIFLFMAIINNQLGIVVEKIARFLDEHMGVLSLICCGVTALMGGGIAISELSDDSDDFKSNILPFICGAIICLPLGMVLAVMFYGSFEMLSGSLNLSHNILGALEVILMTGLVLITLAIMAAILFVLFLLVGVLPCKMISYFNSSKLATILITLITVGIEALLLFLISR